MVLIHLTDRIGLGDRVAAREHNEGIAGQVGRVEPEGCRRRGRRGGEASEDERRRGVAREGRGGGFGREILQDHQKARRKQS